MTACLVSVITQSKRRSTVSGRITFRYSLRLYGPLRMLQIRQMNPASSWWVLAFINAPFLGWFLRVWGCEIYAHAALCPFGLVPAGIFAAVQFFDSGCCCLVRGLMPHLWHIKCPILCSFPFPSSVRIHCDQCSRLCFDVHSVSFPCNYDAGASS